MRGGVLAVGKTALVVATLLVGGCAGPGAAGPDSQPPPSATTSGSASAEATAAPTTPVMPAPATDVPADLQPGPGSWPPTVIYGHVREAGITTIEMGSVSLQIPAGYALTSSPGDPTLQYTAATPQGGVATVTLAAAESNGAAAIDQLTAGHDLARTAVIDIPDAMSAAIGERVTGGQQTWVVALVTVDGQLTTATFGAPVAEFADMLLYQSVCSILVG